MKQVSELESKRQDEHVAICGFGAETAAIIDSHTQAQPGVTHQLLSGHDLSSAVRSAVYTGSHVLIPKAQVTANPSKVQSFSHSIIA